MGKRGKVILLGVILLAFVAVGTKPLWSGGNKEQAEVPQEITSQAESSQIEPSQIESGQSAANQQEQAGTVNVPKLAQLLEDSFAKGKPVAVVYTYNADC